MSTQQTILFQYYTVTDIEFKPKITTFEGTNTCASATTARGGAIVNGEQEGSVT